MQVAVSFPAKDWNPNIVLCICPVFFNCNLISQLRAFFTLSFLFDRLQPARPDWTDHTLVWNIGKLKRACYICTNRQKGQQITILYTLEASNLQMSFTHLVPFPLVRMPHPLQIWNRFRKIWWYNQNRRELLTDCGRHLIMVVPRRRLVIVAGKSNWPGLWVVKPTWEIGVQQ